MSDHSTNRDLSRRLLLGSFGAVGASAALAACSGSSTPPGAGAPSSGAFGKGDTYTGPKVKLAFWNGFTGGDGPFMKGMVEDFNKANPNAQVSMNTLQWGDFYSKVPNAVASGAGPDVAVMHIDQLATNAARRVIVPLDEVASGLQLSEDDFAPVVWNAGVYQDKRYGIPLDIHPLGFYANTAQLSKAGHRRAAEGQGRVRGRRQGAAGEGRRQDAVLGHGDVARAPDVHLAHRPVRRQHLRRARAPRRPSTPRPA